MIDLNQILTVIKKQGATGVLAMWLWYTHSEVQELKTRLYDCYGKGKIVDVNKDVADNSRFAILPKDEITKAIKKRRA